MIATQCTLQSFDTDKIGSGLECFFINCGDFGIKLYACEAEANRVASRQRTASKHGLGPEVLSEVIAYDIPDGLSEFIRRKRPGLGGSILYGYETEVVVMKCHEDGVQHSMVEELKEKFIDILGQILYDAGWTNVGFKKNGEVVCIDFGDCSFDGNF